MTRRETTSDRADAFATVFVLAQELARRADRELASLGLSTSQWLLLAVLHRAFAGQPTRLGEVAAAYGSSRQNVKQIALQLEGKGWLRIEPDPKDGRALLLSPTMKSGVFDAPDWRRRQGRFFSEVFRGLTDDDVATLARLQRTWRMTLTT